MCQTKNSSYKQLFSLLELSEDFFEYKIIERIHEEYVQNHLNDFLLIEKLIEQLEKEKVCPNCKSTNYKSNGKHKNGTQRYLCKNCGKSFNNASDTFLFSSKVNINAWLSFLECLLSGTSVRNACITAKISTVTGTKWMKKIFEVLKKYQDDIILDDTIYIDETYVNEDKSKIFHFEEIGKIKKVKKLPRGISRNKICILVATDKENSFAEIVCNGRPQRIKNYNICLKHIMRESHIIGDEDNSLTYTAKNLDLTRTMYKSNTELAYEKLEPVDQLCNRLKFFLNKHRGFKKDLLQDYLNLFIFIDNEKNKNNDLHLVTLKLLRMLIL